MVYLAVNLGVKQSTLVKGRLSEDGRIVTETVHEFQTKSFFSSDGTLVWDVDDIFSEVVSGIRKSGKIDVISIVGWGSDFVLLSESGERIGEAVSFMDGRTKRLESKPEKEMLFKRLGVQASDTSLLFQLLALRKEHPDQLERAAYLLSIPGYIAYRLTGVIKHEYTYASTSALVNPGQKGWDYELIDSLALPVHLFTELSDPGTEVGRVKADIGVECDPAVILAPSYLQASAALGTGEDEGSAYILSDSTLTVGMRLPSPVLSDEALALDLSNEGGANGTVRLVRKLGGMDLISAMGISGAAQKAQQAKLGELFDVADEKYLAPSAYSLIAAMKENMGEGELAAVVYNSIAISVRDTIRSFERITGRRIYQINAAGKLDSYLMMLIAMYTELSITTVSADAAVLGNLLSQMISTGELGESRRREVIRKSALGTQYRRI